MLALACLSPSLLSFSSRKATQPHGLQIHEYYSLFWCWGWCSVHWSKLCLRATNTISPILREKKRTAAAFLHLGHLHHFIWEDSQNLRGKVTCSNSRKVRTRLSLYLWIPKNIKALLSSCKLAMHRCISFMYLSCSLVFFFFFRELVTPSSGTMHIPT